MKAMILAAGLATRLQPISDTTPKALVKVGEKTMLQIIAEKLIRAGVKEIVVNVHHHARQMKDFIGRLHYQGVIFHISDESNQLLDTGGGLLQAREWLDGDRPFFLYNIDIVSDIDLASMYRAHAESHALAMLAVSDRPSSRFFLWDNNVLTGWINEHSGDMVLCREKQNHRMTDNNNGQSLLPEVSWQTAYVKKAFSGIAVINPHIFNLIKESGVFSIRDVYLRLAKDFEIRCFLHDHRSWHDIGTPEKLEATRRFAANSVKDGSL